jgi:hypothetical protein
MIHDKKLLGVCGETELSNAKQSLITMMQVSLVLILWEGFWIDPFRVRCMSISFRIIWPRLSSLSLDLSLVYPVVSRYTVYAPRTTISRS